MAVHFTADLHFGHENIVTLFEEKRPFASIEEHDEELVRRWNEAVSPDDEVYVVGDFSYRCHPRRMKDLFERLRGTKHLIRGNHDNGATDSLRWASRHDMLRFSPEGVQMFLCHYPCLSWPGSHKGSIHLFGHVHGRTQGVGRSMDVGVDVHGYRPVSLTEVLARMEKIPKPGAKDKAA
jgi:calcineurin-like phosphoesterase family protein